MADQEFLASFGVDIDENGVSRLQQILTENQTLAQSLSDSFNAASESVKAFREQVATDLPSLFSGSGYGNVTENLFGPSGGLKIGLNMNEPKKEIASFTADAKKPIDLAANASGIVSAARTALENVRSLFSETFTINVRASTNVDEGAGKNDSRSSGRNDDKTGSTFQRMSTGGRFTRPTDVQVAEDGDAEYIIPVKKKGRALPLIRQLLSELSPEARQSLTGTEPKSETEGETVPVPTTSAVGTVSNAEKTPSATAIPDSHDVFAEADHPLASAPGMNKGLNKETDASVSVSAPMQAAKEDYSLLSTSAPMPVVKEVDSSLSAQAPLPTVRETFEDADRPLAPAPTSQTESLPSAASSAKQDYSDLISRLSSALQPSGGTVTNTSNNLSAPVTINVNARGSDAEQIGETIYNTAERYLLRTLKAAI